MLLRSVLDSDLPIFFEQERDETARYMAAFVPEDPNDRNAFEAQWKRMRASDSILVRTIVVDSGGDSGDSAAVAGHIASFDRDGEHEVTYWLGREFWGRGIATAALQAFLREDPVRPIYGRVVKDSVASRRVLEKCGFSVCREDKGFAAGRGAEVEEYVLRLD